MAVCGLAGVLPRSAAWAALLAVPDGVRCLLHTNVPVLKRLLGCFEFWRARPLTKKAAL